MMNKPGAVQFLSREDVTHGRLGKRLATNRRSLVPRCHRYRTAEAIRVVVGEGEDNPVNCFHKQDSNDRVTAGMFTRERLQLICPLFVYLFCFLIITFVFTDLFM
jgi:hypothetical protein